MRKKHPEPYKRSDRKGVYYFTLTIDGKRKNISTGEKRKERAREVVRKYVDRVAGGVSTPFGEYAQGYFVRGECPREARLVDEGKNFGPRHMRKSRQVLDDWVMTDSVFPDLPMNEIRRKDVIDLRSRLRDRLPDKLNTAGKALEAVKTILSEAWFREDVSSNPGAQVSKTKFEERERGVFAVEEIRAMLANVSDLCATDKSTHDFTHPRPRAEMLFHLLFLGGLRVGEARALRWRNVNLVQRRFSVVEAFKDVDGTVGAPKWDKKREGLAMPKLLAAAFRRWREYLVSQAGDEGNPYDHLYSSDQSGSVAHLRGA